MVIVCIYSGRLIGAACLRLENAVVIDQKEDIATKLIMICVVSAFMIAALVYMAFLIFYVFDFDFVRRIKLFFLLPFSVFLRHVEMFLSTFCCVRRVIKILLFRKCFQSASVAGEFVDGRIIYIWSAGFLVCKGEVNSFYFAWSDCFLCLCFKRKAIS